MILITGATGKLGRQVLAQLLEKVPARDVAVAVRDPKKAADLAAKGVDVRYADYAKPETLSTALAGVEKLLLISSSEVGQRAPQHAAAIDAAKKAGVKLLVYTSILHADTSHMSLASEHLATEKAIRASGIPHAFLRNGWYIENYTENLGSALAHGVMAGSAKDGKVAAATRADYAAAAVAVLTTKTAPKEILRARGRRCVHDDGARCGGLASIRSSGRIQGFAPRRVRANARGLRRAANDGGHARGHRRRDHARRAR